MLSTENEKVDFILKRILLILAIMNNKFVETLGSLQVC